MFGRRSEKAKKRELAGLRTRARAAMFAGEGVYNVNPWAFMLGVMAAVFAALLTMDWILRDEQPDGALPSASATASHEILVEIE